MKTNQSVKLITSEEDKFAMRMEMTHEQRFRAFMQAIRLQSKLRQAKIVNLP